MADRFLTAIGVSIVAAAAFALFARTVRQPPILGYILGGVALGPHLGLGLVADEASIEAISEMGLILLLFIIGLEISIPSLAQAGRTIAVAGLTQVPLCALLAWWAFGAVAEAAGGRFDRLYLAVALSLSSTLIVVKLLFDKLEMGTLGGRLTLGILIFQDLWAIGFVALQPSLDRLTAGPLVASFAAMLGLVAGGALLSRRVLPRLFRAVARSHELMLLTAVAWCFVVSGVAGRLGLSAEMGALIAGLVIGAFPYGTEVVARLSGVRDFFVTLFFVSLGLKVPVPTVEVLGLAAAAAAVVVAGRFLALYPVFRLLRLDTRTSGVVAVNLSQISEFSLVVVSLGAGYGHVSERVVSLVLYTLLLTSVLSTYAIRNNHRIASALAHALDRFGVRRWMGGGGAVETTDGPGDIFFLGVSREGLALLRHLEGDQAEMKRRFVAIDFNPETLEQLQAEGIACHYGDVTNAETLRHAGIERARVVVSSISDWFLQGTDNLRLLRQARSLAPGARVIVTADTLPAARRLYDEGADYVLIPPALAAERLYELLREPTTEALAAARERQRQELA
ncbi:MAG TPA: cation:proton antiporter, partial [Candidatus Tectomicrobia bacterium]|nr:cation:proton antiporter [Candidatus Tectomicrobia bacterium]